MSETIAEFQVQLDFVFERMDSNCVQWACVEDDSDYPENLASDWCDTIGLFETETWPFPGDLPALEPGDLIYVEGPATIEFSKYWTEYGYEYDSHITWDDDQMKVEVLKAASRAAEMQERIQELEAENAGLRKALRDLVVKSSVPGELQLSDFEMARKVLDIEGKT